MSRLIDRLYQFMETRNLKAHYVERTCGIANGYLGNQKKGSGSMGSDILEKIHRVYPELSLPWLIIGEGEMILDLPTDKNFNLEVREDAARYITLKDELIKVLREQVTILNASLADKDRIIRLLEEKLAN